MAAGDGFCCCSVTLGERIFLTTTFDEELLGGGTDGGFFDGFNGMGFTSSLRDFSSNDSILELSLRRAGVERGISSGLSPRNRVGVV